MCLYPLSFKPSFVKLFECLLFSQSHSLLAVKVWWCRPMIAAFVLFSAWLRQTLLLSIHTHTNTRHLKVDQDKSGAFVHSAELNVCDRRSIKQWWDEIKSDQLSARLRTLSTDKDCSSMYANSSVLHILPALHVPVLLWGVLHWSELCTGQRAWATGEFWKTRHTRTHTKMNTRDSTDGV